MDAAVPRGRYPQSPSNLALCSVVGASVSPFFPPTSPSPPSLRSGMPDPATFRGTLAALWACGGSGWHRVRQRPSALPTPRAPPLGTLASPSGARRPPGHPGPLQGRRPPRSPVPSPLAQARALAAASPAEGPVGSGIWHPPGQGEAGLGRGALQVYPVLKENKIFSWETFPLCVSFSFFSVCSFLWGCLPGSASCLGSPEVPTLAQTGV